MFSPSLFCEAETSVQGAKAHEKAAERGKKRENRSHKCRFFCANSQIHANMQRASEIQSKAHLRKLALGKWEARSASGQKIPLFSGNIFPFLSFSFPGRQRKSACRHFFARLRRRRSEGREGGGFSWDGEKGGGGERERGWEEECLLGQKGTIISPTLDRWRKCRLPLFNKSGQISEAGGGMERGEGSGGGKDSARGGNEVSGSHHADGENFLTCLCRKKLKCTANCVYFL